MIAEGLKGNCSVTEVKLVSAGLLLVRLLLLTCMEQDGNDDMSDAVKREITQGLQERHGADKGVAVAASCLFFDFETCEEIGLSFSNVRLLKVNDAADVRCIPRLPSASSPPAADMHLTPHAAAADGRRHCAAVRLPGAVQAPEEDQLGKQGRV
jgi:hypothetical protein